MVETLSGVITCCARSQAERDIAKITMKIRKIFWRSFLTPYLEKKWKGINEMIT